MMWAFLLRDSNLFSAAMIFAGCVVLILVALYRGEIGRLLDRVLQRSEADAQPVVAQKAETTSFGVTPNIAPESKHAVNLAARIVGDMEKAPIAPDEKIRLLSLLAANNVLRAEFEAKYRIIFKSQMDALAGLRQRGPHSLDSYYQTFLARVEERKEEVTAIGLKTSFEAWAGFISGGAYPYVQIESGVVRITERGDAFMEFTAQTAPIAHGL